VKRVGLVLGLTLLVAPIAVAAEPATDMLIQWGINGDGRGHVLANPVPDGSWGSITWEACTPDGACNRVAPSPTLDKVLDVGDAPVGTTFVATASDGTRSVSGTSIPYRGRLELFSPPTVVGSARTGHFVRPLPATWLGGWGDERPLMQLQVCKTRRDDSCKVIAATFGWDKCPGAGARIAPRYRGWFLRVAEAHEGSDIVLAGRGYIRPEDIEPMRASPITAVATVARIAAGRGPNRPC
jgi:hypothetical protein